MWYRRRALWGFGFGMPPFGFFRSWRHFPSRSDYMRMLEEYKQDLEAELEEVKKEIEELKRESAT